jgi:RNA polymerase sigma factor (TIGR02999 family)
VYTVWGNLVSEGKDHENLFNDLYGELKSMARGKVASERPGATLNATALVHEAWMRLEKSSPEKWRDRSHFFAAASEAMRRILVEAARKRLAAKRGSGADHVCLDDVDIASDTEAERLVDVHEVLKRLEQVDPMKAEIVKYKFFCGFENEETAAVLGVNEKTVRRHWEVAKVWLYREIQKNE